MVSSSFRRLSQCEITNQINHRTNKVPPDIVPRVACFVKIHHFCSSRQQADRFSLSFQADYCQCWPAMLPISQDTNFIFLQPFIYSGGRRTGLKTKVWKFLSSILLDPSLKKCRNNKMSNIHGYVFQVNLHLK